MKRLLTLAALLSLTPAGRAADPVLKDVLDFTARPRLLDTHFARFGTTPNRTVSKEPGGVRVRLPAAGKGASQSGVYSYFALAGDLEVTGTFESVSVPTPSGGYGASASVILDAEGTVGSVALNRGLHPAEGSAFWVTRTTPDGEAKKYDTWFFPAAGRRGRFAIRRQKDAVTFLAADAPGDPLRELKTVPFTAGTVRSLRLAGDAGNSPTTLDVRVTELVVRAEELTGGIPEMEIRAGWGRTVAGVVAAALVLVGVALAWRRRRKRRRGEPEA